MTINEPSPATTLEILKGVKGLYEKHHHVTLPEDVLKAAVDYSVQYMPQRTLPDKAIDLIDMTAAHLAAGNAGTDEASLKEQLKTAEKTKEDAAKAEDYEKAAKAKEQVDKLQAQIKNTDDSTENKVVATPNDVAESVQRLTGIPVAKMGTNDIQRLKGVAKRLKSKVIGQDEAVEWSPSNSAPGWDDEGNWPIGSFLFVGQPVWEDGIESSYLYTFATRMPLSG